MKGKEVYKIWAPSESIWSPWVRPVPFVAIDNCYENHEFYDFTIPNVNYLYETMESTAVIVDLPGYRSINEGLSLARMGYVPVPVYNGTNEPNNSIATTNNHIIEPALIWGATELLKIESKKNGFPVFLMDTNRMNRYRINGKVFDNSYDMYHQDLPSADFFLKNGIDKILVRSDSMQKDLIKILYGFQKKGITILFTNGYTEPKIVKLRKPSKDKE